MAKRLVENAKRMNADTATRLVRLAGGFRSLITLETGGKQVNAKSLMGVMTLEEEKSRVVLVTATGADAGRAADAVAALLEGRPLAS